MKMKRFFRDNFFKIVDEETFDKKIFMKNLKIGGIALVVGLTIGGIANSKTSQIEELQAQASKLSEDKNEYVELYSERSGIISSRDAEIKELESKVENASPWFEMEEAEQEAERERIAQKKAEEQAEAQAQKEAEEQAKKEEEERKKEERRVASEKAASEKTEKQTESSAESGGDPLVEEGLNILRENMGGIANISYKNDTSTFLVNPTGDDFKQELLEVSKGNLLDEWDVLVDGMVRLSYSMRNALPGKTVALINPFNEGNFLLLLKDGLIEYDFTQE